MFNICQIAVKEFFDNTTNKKEQERNTSGTLSSFDFSDGYSYPRLFEEADAMLQVSLLIYTITDLRGLAKKKDCKLKNPERLLSLPLKLADCIEIIEGNLELIKGEFNDEDHEMTMSALQYIHQRYKRNSSPSSSTSNDNSFWNPFASPDGGSTSKAYEAPAIVAYGDTKPDSELVYAVGIDSSHKRVTVVFRGSVTTTDFVTDACIALKHQENPMKDAEASQMETIGIHYGFFDYLFKVGDNRKNKYDEILEQVTSIFKNPDIRQTHKLYVSGHSLGGALATLFSFHVSAEVFKNKANHPIPAPVSCVSIASPRVGEISFLSAFTLLERRGALRHLRIANETDPVTMMPQVSGKMIWAKLSPISYAAFKMIDRSFEEKETYHHTGIELKLRKTQESTAHVCVNYSGSSKAQANAEKMPDVAEHMVKAYCDNLVKIKVELNNQKMTLNELYGSHAASDETD
mmetsp:Transcript_5294/g.7634  ORF Transcript_5294/g.7634 Transcript_5294/m.7634 type:complete len:461 (-) Transcript_5294:67-1449(-)